MAGRQSAATEKALKLWATGKWSKTECADKAGIDYSTFWRAIKRTKERKAK